ncbi:hypothetical protein F5Y04DRAFT_288693 [Hypomontagnella monticulosa]|nr:hypothetical protein F5Y04DRAFT_288693 [Hypomontagnella monticulosa]
MDPLSALSTASSAIQIIDFTIRFLSQVKELHDSVEGEIEEFTNLRGEAQYLFSLNKSLIEALKSLKSRKSNREFTALEQDIISLCTESDAVAAELVKELNKVPRGQQSAGTVGALRGVIVALWRRRSIQKLHQRLLGLRSTLTSTILANIQHDLITGGGSGGQTVHPSAVSWGGTMALQDWARSQKKDMEKLEQNLLDAVASSHWRVIQSLESKRWNGLKSWDDSPVVQTLEISLLERLQYGEISDREGRIPQAFQKTFDWIYSDPIEAANPTHSWSSFKDWLAYGTGIYWITGKAGSGKSTLMKMLCQDMRTTALLESWSGSTPIVTASFYFWNSGTELQMSQEGLLRSLLHQGLSKRFALNTKSSSSSKWGAFSLSVGITSSVTLPVDEPLPWEQLTQGLRFLVEEDEESLVNYVFFIDGLDEYSGEPSKLISLLQLLASYPNVKICTSSRPWIVFEDSFKQQPNLMLQHRTHHDIAFYANQNLSNNTAFRELYEYDPGYAMRLVDNITSKASGVFLWVVLVVRSLIEGLENGDKPTELQARLDELPEELDALFKKMLHGLEGKYFRDAAGLFQIFRAAKRKPSVLVLSFADNEDINWALSRPMGPFEPKEVWYRALTMKRRLDSRCKGLLEIGPLRQQPLRSNLQTSDQPNTPNTLGSDLKGAPAVGDLRIEDGHLLAAAEVDYLHRTVKDFLTSPKIWHRILDAPSRNFNPHASLFRAYLVQLKSVSPEELNTGIFWTSVARCLEQIVDLGNNNTKLYIDYLDAVNESAIQLTSQENDRGVTYIRQFWGSSDHHWVSTGSLGQKDDCFLTFAVRCNLTRYLCAKFDEVEPSQQLASRLLDTAINRCNAPLLPAHGLKQRKQKKPNAEIVRLLLQNNADPKLDSREVLKVIDSGSKSKPRPKQSIRREKAREKARLRDRRLLNWTQGVAFSSTTAGPYSRPSRRMEFEGIEFPALPTGPTETKTDDSEPESDYSSSNGTTSTIFLRPVEIPSIKKAQNAKAGNRSIHRLLNPLPELPPIGDYLA